MAPLYPVERMWLCLVMTAPVGLELQVDRELTIFAMSMKYSCQLGRLRLVVEVMGSGMLASPGDRLHNGWEEFHLCVRKKEGRHEFIHELGAHGKFKVGHLF